MPYYDEMNGNAYVGGTMGMDMMSPNDTLKATNQLPYNNNDEMDYSANRARVMSEIIV